MQSEPRSAGERRRANFPGSHPERFASFPVRGISARALRSEQWLLGMAVVKVERLMRLADVCVCVRVSVYVCIYEFSPQRYSAIYTWIILVVGFTRDLLYNDFDKWISARI